jgi:catechol 2,3-dioxygenase-like lactoylglutathione lyase family enzyme
MTTVRDIAYVRYAAPDLHRMEAFLKDFGLSRAARTDRALYMRAADTQPFAHVTELAAAPATIGFGLLANSATDLDQAASQFGVPVEASMAPGGGRRVRLKDPSGFEVDIVHGQQANAALPLRAPVATNPYTGRNRFGGVVRLAPKPSTVVRLGHVAVLVKDYKASLLFYQQLGFRESDTLYVGQPENRIASFMRCGLGAEYSDHHTIALIQSQDGQARFDHSAFEVLDLDDIMQGQAFLRSRGHEHSWGLGRHIQGSQLFDYWRDPYGHKIEHWTDGDLVNDDTPVGNAAFTEAELSQWAPPLSPEFFR